MAGEAEWNQDHPDHPLNLAVGTMYKTTLVRCQLQQTNQRLLLSIELWGQGHILYTLLAAKVR